MNPLSGNWEAEQLEKSLARRVGKGLGAYWVAGRQEAPPVPPISLTGGIPDPDTLPIEELIECSNRVLRREGPEALRYGGQKGYEGLCEWLAAEANRRDGLSLTADNFMITNGISSGLFNVAETFLDEGDVGLAELPTFPSGAGTITHCMGECVGVPVDEDGLIPEALEETIERLEREGRRIKVIYIIASYQNPTGSMLTLERRHRVVDICQRHGILIMEDDAYGDIRLEGERVPTLFSIAEGKGVVYLGTFSKTIATGLRIGWVLADPAIINAMLSTRYDLGLSPWLQRTLLEFANEGHFDRHVNKMLGVYRSKLNALDNALQERCSSLVTWSRPKGGFFLWLTLAESVDPAVLADAARTQGVAYVGGRVFHHGQGGQHTLRLAFSHVAEREIPEAIMRLGRALEEASKASG
ncbi:MAG: PLP-dependent aminotransferase family protein [Dehalococcoidia bacterium]